MRRRYKVCGCNTRHTLLMSLFCVLQAKGDNKVLEDRLRETKRENNELNARIKALEKELKAASKAAGAGVSDVSVCLQLSYI